MFHVAWLSVVVHSQFGETACLFEDSMQLDLHGKRIDSVANDVCWSQNFTQLMKYFLSHSVLLRNRT